MKDSQASRGSIEVWRINALYIAIILVFGFYAFRLFDIQILQGDDRLSEANNNRTDTVSIQTHRGIIYDRNGYVLARNIPSYNVMITPAYLPEGAGAIQEIYRQLSQLLGIPVSYGETDDATVRLFKPCESELGITQIVYIGETNAPYNPVPIKCDVDPEIAMIVREKAYDWPGTGIEIVPIREYPTGWITAEVIGFLGPIPAVLEDFYTEQGFIPNRDKVGYAGIEYTLQDVLGGRNGRRVVEVDVAGKVLRDLEAQIDPVPGNNLVLTIDTRLQNAAKTALIEEINSWNVYLNEIRSANGVVIAINPKTGEILALVSYPTYENNRMARFIPGYYYGQLENDPNRPLFNHAISAEHPPGSVYKMAAAIGAMNEHVLEPTDILIDPGKITIDQKFTENDPGTPRDYVCWTDAGHGEVDYIHAIAYSCDVYFYKISGGYKDEVPVGLNIWRMAEYARALGYGQLTGIELPGESTGLVPDPTWKRINVGENWSTGDTYIAAMGQGFILATPLQVLVSFAILANDGVYMRPTLVREIQDAEGNVIQPFEPEQVWDITKDPLIEIYDENFFPTGEKKVVEPWVVELSKEGMRMVVEEGGTADRPFEGMDIPSAGKTGTAEYCDNVAQSKNLCQPGNWPTHAWYVGYAPFDDPEIAVVAFVYNGGEGASVAAPIVRLVLEAYFELKAIDSAAGPTL
ncbi:MAG: penicillin-binding protein 2 [Anaerolineaceae bacterium]|nr:penicillin-binding protein 2 [Anaerolineaceae bacterium]